MVSGLTTGEQEKEKSRVRGKDPVPLIPMVSFTICICLTLGIVYFSVKSNKLNIPVFHL